MSELSTEYFAKREAEARLLAEKATDRGVRRIHLQMAERYEKLKKGGGPVPLRIVSE